MSLRFGTVFEKEEVTMPPLVRPLGIALCAGLLSLFVFSGHGLAASPMPDASGTVSDDTGSITVSAGAKYLMPQQYKGSDMIYWGVGVKIADTNISRPDAMFAPSVSLAAERKTSLELAGLSTIRLVGEFSYVGGSARSSGLVSPGAVNTIIFISVDPAYNWIGGIAPIAGGSATTRVSIALDNFDLRLGLEGDGSRWQSGEGLLTATPVFGVGLYAATQRYKVSTRLEAVSNSDTYNMSETMRTTDIGPELRAGIKAELPGGATLSAMASAALLVGWADLGASQVLNAVAPNWDPRKRSPTYSAEQSENEVLVSGLFGLTLRGDMPVAEKCTLGLEASGRIWTSRPTIDNPTSLGGTGVVATGTNEGVRIGHDSASELGAALRLNYTF